MPIVGFLASRLLQSLIVLIAVSFVVYQLVALMPGDPIDLMMQGLPNATAEDRMRLRALYGLDVPPLERWWHWLTAALQGDFGPSREHKVAVVALLPERLGNTLLLVGLAILVSLLVAIVLGMAAACRPLGLVDTLVSGFAFAGISLPAFWAGLMLILLFSERLGWLPAGGAGPVGGEGGFLARLPYLAMPVMTLVIINVGLYTRYVRAAMIDVLRQDYIRTARSKGLREGRIVRGHALKNALIPLITVAAVDVGSLFSGAVITETLFGFPGMGRLIYDSVQLNDYNAALAAIMVATAAILLANLVADILYAALDPRVTLGTRVKG